MRIYRSAAFKAAGPPASSRPVRSAGWKPGYIIEIGSRTLVESTGLEVVGVTRDESLTLFVVNHNGTSLEAFGPAGRLWKAGPIGCGGFRSMDLAEDALVGEARHPGPREWVPFSVNLATGEVGIED